MQELGPGREARQHVRVEAAFEYEDNAWGIVTNDTNPGFQPFGFGGGLAYRRRRLHVSLVSGLELRFSALEFHCSLSPSGMVASLRAATVSDAGPWVRSLFAGRGGAVFVGDVLGACGEVWWWAVVVGAVEDLGAQEALHLFPVSICVSDRGQVEP